MNREQFENEVVRLFPDLAEDVEEYTGLMHPIFGSLYRLAQTYIASEDWMGLERLFRSVGDRNGRPRMSVTSCDYWCCLEDYRV